MHPQIVVVTLCLAVFANGYSFDDPLFNQILASELAEIQDDLPAAHPRTRRDEEAASGKKCTPRLRKSKFCCAEESFKEHQAGNREIMRECFRTHRGNDTETHEMDPFRCEKSDKHRKDMTCTIQCYGIKKNILDKEGMPLDAEFGAFVAEAMAKEAWFGAIQDEVIAKCLEEAKNVSVGRDAGACNPSAATLQHCLFREVQLACPAEEIKDQKMCSAVRENIKRHSAFLQSQNALMHDE